MYLGLDLGTSSIKAAIFDEAGTLCWVADTTYDSSVAEDRVEIDPEAWWQACRAVMSGTPGELAGKVRAIGLSGQMHGLVLTDSGNRPVRNAILWPDRRATAEVKVFAEVDAASPGSLANPLVPGMPGPMLLWLKAHEPHIWRVIKHVVSPKDWVRSRLIGSGNVATDPSDASATLLWDVRIDDWSPDVLRTLDLDRSKLPRIVGSDQVVGTLSGQAAGELGLEEGLPVAAGAGDAAAALLGLGVESPGTVVLNVGTAGQALGVVGDAPRDLAHALYAQYHTAGSDSAWYAMAPVLNAGLALNWVRTVLAMEWEDLFGEAGHALTKVPSDPRFVPYLAGERDPAIGLDARGAWFGLSVSHDRAALARSALVGVGSYLAHRTRLLVGLIGGRRIVLSGGSTRNLDWAQLLTTLIGQEVDIAVDANASVRGAAILAARSQGGDIPVMPTGGHLKPDVALIDLGDSCIADLTSTDINFWL